MITPIIKKRKQDRKRLWAFKRVIQSTESLDKFFEENRRQLRIKKALRKCQLSLEEDRSSSSLNGKDVDKVKGPIPVRDNATKASSAGNMENKDEELVLEEEDEVEENEVEEVEEVEEESLNESFGEGGFGEGELDFGGEEVDDVDEQLEIDGSEAGSGLSQGSTLSWLRYSYHSSDTRQTYSQSYIISSCCTGCLESCTDVNAASFSWKYPAPS